MYTNNVVLSNKDRRWSHLILSIKSAVVNCMNIRIKAHDSRGLKKNEWRTSRVTV